MSTDYEEEKKPKKRKTQLKRKDKKKEKKGKGMHGEMFPLFTSFWKRVHKLNIKSKMPIIAIVNCKWA